MAPKKTIKKTSAEYEQEYFTLIAKVDKKFEKFKITKEKDISHFKAKCGWGQAWVYGI